ncbi:MAG: hypothetical protein AABY13_00015 [Nanoarchaeota archaeon]
MSKRGQLTITILMGIVLIIAVSLILYIQQPRLLPSTLLPATTLAEAERSLHDCWEQAGRDALAHIGATGGTILPFVYDLNDTVRVAVSDGAVTVPTKIELENELSYGMAVLASQCEADIAQRAAPYGVVMTNGTTLVSTTVLPHHTIFIFHTDIAASDQDRYRKIDDHIVVIDTHLGRLASLAHTIATDVVENGDIDLSLIAGQGVEASIRGGPSSISSVLLTQYERPPNMTATFLVAFDQEGERPSNPPRIRQLDPIFAPAGKQTLGVVIAHDPLDEPLLYDALNALIYIDKRTGAFAISPTTFDIGTYPVTFYVTNSRGETSTMTTEVRVA